MKNLFIKLKVLAELIISFSVGYAAIAYSFSSVLVNILLIIVSLFILSQALGNIDFLNGYNQPSAGFPDKDDSHSAGKPDSADNPSAGLPDSELDSSTGKPDSEPHSSAGFPGSEPPDDIPDFDSDIVQDYDFDSTDDLNDDDYPTIAE